MATKLTKQAQLDDIKQQIVADGVTPELAAEATTMVFGEGSPDAQVVFVGEAPGKQEDLTGRPFIGASGRILTEMLQAIGLKREDVYITSILKYRPPGNRDPRPDEKRAFLPYLHQQLAVIKPKVVAMLGRHSLNCFLPDAKIGAVHGVPQRVKLSLGEGSDDTLSVTVTILPLYHPAAALYNPRQRQTLMDDFMVIPALLKK